MDLRKTFYVFIAALILQACKHPLAIQGQGDIVDLNAEANSGLFGCTLEQFQSNDPACDNDITTDYFVNYSAVPREGWRFVRWEGGACGHLSVPPNCRFDVPAIWSLYWDENFAEIPIPALTAVFEEAGGSNGSLLGTDMGVAATVNGQVVKFTDIFQVVFVPETTILGNVIPRNATIQARTDVNNVWNIVVPAEVGMHPCNPITDLRPWNIALTLEGAGYSTAGNGFIVPSCEMNVTAVSENSIKGTFTATLVDPLDNNSVFAEVVDGEFDVVDP